MIQVTAAIIQKNGKLLLCQRLKGKRCELLWEFPGGKINPGETPEKCIVRECYEELNIIIEAERLVREVDYAYSDIAVNIQFYFCKLIDGEPVCIEHNDIKWLTLDNISRLPLCPADYKMLSLASEDIRRYLVQATSN